MPSESTSAPTHDRGSASPRAFLRPESSVPLQCVGQARHQAILKLRCIYHSLVIPDRSAFTKTFQLIGG